MLSGNQVLIKNSFFSYIKLGISSIFGLISSRYVLLYLGVADFGLYSVVGSIVVLMNFLNTVMVSTSHRFIAVELGKGSSFEVNRVFNVSFTIHLLIALFVLLSSETLGVYYIKSHLNIPSDKILSALIVFRLSIFAVVINILSVPFQGLITAKERFKSIAIIEVGRALLNFLFILGLIGLSSKHKLVMYALMMSILNILVSATYVTSVIRTYYKLVYWNFQKDLTMYKEMFAFSGWIMIGASAHIGKDAGSQVLVNSFFGTVSNAAFGVANRLNSFAIMFSQSLSQVAIPQITKTYSSGNSLRANQLAVYISKYSFLLFFIAALPALIETDFILRLWLGNVPQFTKEFSRLMLANGLIDCLLAGVPALVQASGRVKWFQIVGSTIMLSSLPLAYLLFSRGYSPVFISVSYISTSLLNLYVSLYLLKRVVDFDIEYFRREALNKVLKVIIVTSPLFLILVFLEQSIFRFFLTLVLSFIALFISIFFIGLDFRERSVFRKYFINFLRQL